MNTRNCQNDNIDLEVYANYNQILVIQGNYDMLYMYL